MAGGIWTIETTGAVAMSAATARTILAVRAHANSSNFVYGFTVSLDGVTASAVPGVIELVHITFASNGPGTNSTSVTPVLSSGRSTTVGFTAGRSWTTEPTVISTIKRFTLSPNGGTYDYDFPLQLEPDTALNEGIGLRLTYAATVNAYASMKIGRC